MWGAGQLRLTGLAHHAVLWLLEFAVCMTPRSGVLLLQSLVFGRLQLTAASWAGLGGAGCGGWSLGWGLGLALLFPAYLTR